MSLVGIRELKTNASELVRRVREQGEIIDITYYGEVVARLVPVKEIKTRDEELSELWAEMDRLAQEVSMQWSGSPSAVDAVREGRREL
ncbi:MAG: type II toxin-antitoxin system prevent-host-death family antitoxin [Anaerolineae bacterium]|nr:type II toxin-antitoxin system prevent-host-death family antitoxin [Anaerolineae bacterium]